MQERRPLMLQSTLSEENLEKHNAIYPMRDGHFQENLIREEKAQAIQQELYRRLYEDKELQDRTGVSIIVDASGAEVLDISDSLKMYPGPLASSETPMSRFMTISPAQDTQPWMAKDTMDATGINCGDLETLDLRRLAAEFISLDSAMDDSRYEGSLQPSSPTLSTVRVSSNGAVAGARVKKRIGIRKRNSLQQRQQVNSRDTVRGGQGTATLAGNTSPDSGFSEIRGPVL